MAILDILTYPDARLKQIADPVEVFDAELQEFVAELDATRLVAPGCVGIAAPQVGRLQRLVIVDLSGRRDIQHHGHMVLINPEIKIGLEAIAVHGIRNRDIEGKPTFRDKAQELWDVFHDCYYSGFNIINFDDQ